MNNYCDINCNHEEGFSDLTFDIITFKKTLFGDIYIECAANDSGKNVGFALKIKKCIKGLKVENGNINPNSWTCHYQGIKIIYLIDYSDSFIKSLLKAYEFNDMDLKLNKVSPVEAGCLSAEPMDYENKKLDFKCFINSNCNTNLYAEFYINVDLPNKKVEFREKDVEYRENIIRYLSRKY